MPRMSATLYTVGGTVRSDKGLYITRPADKELLEVCRAGTFAYILSPRQLGKSSLMMRTAHSLADDNIRFVIIDLTQIGIQVTPEAWYLGLLAIIEEQLFLKTDVIGWWQANSHLGLTQRLTRFFEEVLIKEIEEPVVIFVDEIDTTLSLDFTDDFFAAIRYFYNARIKNPDLEKLSFVLIGVATPGDLIRDPKRTPFNIGQRVDLTDFTLEEALPLAGGLGLPLDDTRRVLERILKWTGGHPYLTQRLCQTIALERRPSWSDQAIDELVEATFFGPKSERDANLQFVRDMLVRRNSTPGKVLETYRQVWLGRKVVDEEQSVVKSHLKLSGIVRSEGSILKVRNLIYQKVFDKRWIKEHLPFNWLAFVRRVAPVVLPLFILSLLYLVIFILSVQSLQTQAGEAESARVKAIAAQTTADARLGQAEAAQQEAGRQRKLAQAQALAYQSQAVADPETGLLIAIEGMDRVVKEQLDDPNQQVESALRQAIQSSHLKRVFKANPSLNTSNRTYSTVAFSPDSNLIGIVPGGKDNLGASSWSLELWDARTTSLVPVAKLQPGELADFSFSPDGKLVVTGYGTLPAKIFDVATGKELAIHLTADRPVFSPDSRLLAGAAYQFNSTKVQPEVGVWEVATGKQLFVLKGHTSRITSINFSSDGKLLVTSSGDNTIRVWNVTTGQEVTAIRNQGDSINDVNFSPDSKFIVSADQDKTAYIWETATGQEIATLTGHKERVDNALYSPDGKYIVTSSEVEGITRLWLASSATEIAILQGFRPTFSPDSRFVATGDTNGLVRVWQATGQQIATLQGHTNQITKVSFSSDGQFILSSSNDGTARIWEVGTGPGQVFASKQPGGFTAVTYSSDGNQVVTTSEDGSIQTWDTTASPPYQPVVPYAKPLLKLRSPGGRVNSVTYSKDGQLLLTAGADGTARTWNAATGQPVTTFKGHTGAVNRAAFDPTSQILATAGQDGTARIWDTASGKELVKFTGHTGAVHSLAFSPDGKRVVSGGSDFVGRVWEVATGRELVSLKGHTNEILSVAFSPDGKLIATASSDGTSRVWNAESGGVVAVLRGHFGLVYQVNFSPDGRFVVTAGQDATARIWESGNGKLVNIIRYHLDQVYGATFSPDGKSVATASADGTVQINPCEICVPAPELLELARKRVTRELTDEEKQQYGLK